jgi:hypothetical protein
MHILKSESVDSTKPLQVQVGVGECMRLAPNFALAPRELFMLLF